MKKFHWYEFSNWFHQHTKLGRAWYWFRTHTYNRYHLLDLRGQGDYEWGYVDPCWKMYLACFAILVDYVEKEKGLEVIDWSWNEDHAEAGRTIKELYDWWKTGRSVEHEAVDQIGEDLPGNGWEKMSHGPEWEQFSKLVQELEEKDKTQLNRLIAIRGALWT